MVQKKPRRLGVPKFAAEPEKNVEMMQLVMSKSDNQTLASIFRFLQEKWGEPTYQRVEGRWYFHVRQHQESYREMACALQESGAASAVENTEPQLKLVFPPRKALDQRVESSTAVDENAPIMVKQAYRIARYLESVLKQNDGLISENAKLKVQVKTMVPKAQHDLLVKELKATKSALKESDALIEGFANFRKRTESTEYTVGRSGEVTLK